MQSKYLIALLSASLSAACLVQAQGTWQLATFAGTGAKGSSGDGGQAAEAQLNNPFGLARGPDGALYFCDTDNHKIRKISKPGIVTTVAGKGSRGYSGDGGPAQQAELNEPYELRFDKSGNLFFVEMQNHLVRSVDARTGIIRTVAGSGAAGFGGDGGPAIKALMKQPHSIQFDAEGKLFICDIGNNRIRWVDRQTGVIATFAGTGVKSATPDGTSAKNAPLNGPRAIDFDRDGNLWLALREGNQILEWKRASDTFQLVAGTGAEGFTGNGGPAAKAALSGPKGLSVGPDGNVYFTDTGSHSVRMINRRAGTVELLAGTGARGDGPDGPGTAAGLAHPHGIFVDSDGSVFVGDTENHKVRRLRR